MAPEIDSIRANDEHNYAVSVSVLGSDLEMVEDTHALYVLFSTLLDLSPTDASSEGVLAHRIALTFFGACRYQFSMSVLSVMRGRCTDGMIYLRRAIELCGFGALVQRHPHKAVVWLNSADSDEAYRTYQDKFDNKALFPEREPLLKALYQRYDLCSKAMHSSIIAISQHVRFVNGEARYSYGDIDEVDDGRLVSAFDYLIDTHHDIQRVFAGAFQKGLAERIDAWETPFRAIELKQSGYRVKRRPTVESLLRR